MNSDQLEDYGKRLQDKQQELQGRLQAIREDTGRALSPDWPEQATQLENAEVLDELAREAAEELQLVQQAMVRRQTGTYGHCTQCRALISTERLDALPWAPHCIDCAARSH